MLILGQGIEVEEKDFAAEVAATAGNRELDFEKIILEESFIKVVW